jgi:hypothetical protein
MSQQAVAGVFDEIEHMLEALRAPAVRVGHHGAVVAQAELGQAANLALVLAG